MSLIVFVINLESRVDRWLHVTNELDRLNLKATRISAIDNPDSDVYFTQPKVAACWMSHRKALEAFLESNSSTALILEDDFEFKNSDVTQILSIFSRNDLDFLQIGFLFTTWKEHIYIRLENLNDFLIRFYGRLESIILHQRISKKNLVNERRNLSPKIVLSDIRPGAHAYLVNRRGAEYLCAINSPIFLSTDDLYKSIGPMRHIRMGRLKKSAVSQIKSTSSINPR